MNTDVELTILEKLEILEKNIEELKLNSQKVVPLVYSTKELAIVMGISLNYANKLMNYPDFPSMKLGGKWKVSKTALEEWLERNKWKKTIDLD